MSEILSDRSDLTPVPLPPDKSFKTISSWIRCIGLLLPFAVMAFLCWRDPLYGMVYLIVMLLFVLLAQAVFVPVMLKRRAKKNGPLSWREPR